MLNAILIYLQMIIITYSFVTVMINIYSLVREMTVIYKFIISMFKDSTI